MLVILGCQFMFSWWTGVLFTTKNHPRTKDLSVGLTILGFAIWKSSILFFVLESNACWVYHLPCIHFLAAGGLLVLCSKEGSYGLCSAW